jgi:hypothetical protein
MVRITHILAAKEKGRKAFYFEKKKQKTFALWLPRRMPKWAT